jgi:hypothetical protein
MWDHEGLSFSPDVVNPALAIFKSKPGNCIFGTDDTLIDQNAFTAKKHNSVRLGFKGWALSDLDSRV